MADIDVFNGDADGICALQQLRLAEPLTSRLVSGVKRDIALLKQVDADAQDRVTVLDISLDKNREPLLRLLQQGVRVSYYDHHYAGEIPVHPALQVHIDPTPDRGTSYLVDQALGGRYRSWAVVGTFGDNFDTTAEALAEPLGLEQHETAQLRELGILLNYNGYGSQVADLHVSPVDLFRRIQPYADPLRFAAEDETMLILREGYRSDMAKAGELVAELENETHALYILPEAAWSRRVGGVFANQLAQQASGRAHAILTCLHGGGFLVSVRAPVAQPTGADALCRRFATGGGRNAAAGINQLPDEEFERFRREFQAAFNS